MKRIQFLLLPVLCGFHLPATAQITVTSATFPAVGDTLRGAYATNPGPVEQYSNPPGVALNWDFSSLVAGRRITLTFLPAGAGAHAASFPVADMVVTNSSGETYYRTSNGKLEILGHVGVARASTDTFGATFVAAFNTPLMERTSAINWFDIRQLSSTGLISFPPVADLPESMRLFLQTSYSPATDIRIRFDYVGLKQADASGELRLPGMAAPKEVLRIKNTLSSEYRIELRMQPLGWIEIGFASVGGEWIYNCGCEAPASTLDFLISMQGQVDAIMEGILVGEGLRESREINMLRPPFISYQFLSATDKEELAVARLAYDLSSVAGVSFKDFNPPPPPMRIAGEAAGVSVYWPVGNSAGWSLRVTGHLNPANWQPAPGEPAHVGSEFRYFVSPPLGASKFFRLETP
jgi:hypothetical protein